MRLAIQAAKGKTLVADDKKFWCIGGGVGLGFGNQYKIIPAAKTDFVVFFHQATRRERVARKQLKR
ncbi:MAG TPA: DUF169 domain-containing protein [Smithellaceae bacterium]|nr:DUF169 domain-containing protein [Smithellaceae bacterium]HRS89810.1 DUF169 domain-containing protein [Smithellaceae bacterium]HRV26679.1 DUF169 domain-containing protein [Smithellaceae bacterium]